MSTLKVETEAKFIVPDLSTFIALQKVTWLDDFELKPMGIKIVTDRYLDTANKDLYQAGFACRLRMIKHRQILSIKALTPAEGSVHRRREIEMDIDTDQPQNWAAGEAKDLILTIVGETPLQTLFVLYQTRHKYDTFLQGRPVIEFSLDQVSLSDPNIIDYFELEAELMEGGNEADLDFFIKALQAQWPLKAETRSKFQRALAIASL